MYFDKDGCCCGSVSEEGCCQEDGNDENCNCEEDGCDCGHDHGQATIVMTDAETGEDYTFVIADDFPFENDHYCVLITTDEEEPEMVITKVVAMEDGTEGLKSLTEDEYDRVYAEYERLCEEEDYEVEDDEE